MLNIANIESHPHERTMEFLFQHVPTKINGNDKVESITFKTADGEKTINCGLVISAIGYQPKPAEGLQIEGSKLTNTDGHISENLFVVGWAKRGPSGVIGTNKSDAAEVMKKLVEKLPSNPKSDFDLSTVLNAEIITQPIWERINQAEISAGEPLGKPRKKIVSVENLLKAGN